MTYRSYEKINGQILATGTYQWASTTYARMLMLASDTIPDSVAATQYVSASSFGTYSSPATGINANFILPYPLDLVSVIDGVVTGNLKVSNYGYGDTEGTTSTLRTIKVQLKVIDSAGNSRDLTELTTVWSGLLDGMYQETKTVSLMYWININANIGADERIVLNVQTTGHSGASNFAWHRLYADKNTDTLSITLPFII